MHEYLEHSTHTVLQFNRDGPKMRVFKSPQTLYTRHFVCLQPVEPQSRAVNVQKLGSVRILSGERWTIRAYLIVLGVLIASFTQFHCLLGGHGFSSFMDLRGALAEDIRADLDLGV